MTRSRIFSVTAFLALGLALGAGGTLYLRRPAAVVAAKKQLYRCPMHPQIVQDHPGKCPICGMNLVPADSVSQSAPACPVHPGASGGCCGGAAVDPAKS